MLVCIWYEYRNKWKKVGGDGRETTYVQYLGGMEWTIDDATALSYTCGFSLDKGVPVVCFLFADLAVDRAGY